MAGVKGQLDTENISKMFNRALFSALYAYQANRPTSEELTNPSDPSVAKFLQREATSNSDFSLSAIVTDLPVEQEAQLREFIAKRLSKGTVYGGSGNVNNVEIGVDVLSCYYYLLRQTSLDLEAELDGADGNFYTSQEYVVCFMSLPTAGLELFRPELDAYCEGLLYLLDQKTLDKEKIKTYLSNWYKNSTEYVNRCVQMFKADTAHLITCALMEVQLDVKGGRTRIKEDIKKFIKACSLSELLQQSDSEVQNAQSADGLLIDFDITDSGESSETSSNQGDKAILLIDGDDSYRFENSEKSPVSEEWIKFMMSGDVSNPAFLRQVIEDYKLRTIQELNTLKRLIRQAETDHYALYRAYLYLKDIGSGAILLRLIWKDETTVNIKETQNVLQVLEDFLRESNGFKRVQTEG